MLCVTVIQKTQTALVISIYHLIKLWFGTWLQIGRLIKCGLDRIKSLLLQKRTENYKQSLLLATKQLVSKTDVTAGKSLLFVLPLHTCLCLNNAQSLLLVHNNVFQLMRHRLLILLELDYNMGENRINYFFQVLNMAQTCALSAAIDFRRYFN